MTRKFDEFNEMCFGGQLPRLPLRLSNARTQLGVFVHPANYPAFLPRGKGECFMKVSVRLDLPEREVEDIIIHEMIHYYIWYKKLRDTSAHGQTFRTIMKGINERHGRNISVRFKSTQDIQDTDTHTRNNYICVTRWADRQGLYITLCARTRIFEIHDAFSNAGGLLSMEWYWSRDSWFNRIPVSIRPGFRALTQEDFEMHFRNAVPCECDGRVFRPKARSGSGN